MDKPTKEFDEFCEFIHADIKNLAYVVLVEGFARNSPLNMTVASAVMTGYIHGIMDGIKDPILLRKAEDLEKLHKLLETVRHYIHMQFAIVKEGIGKKKDSRD